MRGGELGQGERKGMERGNGEVVWRRGRGDGGWEGDGKWEVGGWGTGR